MIPIIKLSETINEVYNLLSGCGTEASALDESAYAETIAKLKAAGQLIAKEKGYDAKSLKALFNRYSDNIFYTDKSEANLYLQGGTSPGSQQTTAYLFRNQIITSIENVQDDINAMISDLETIGSSDKEFIRQNFADTVDDLTEVQTYMDKYLRLVDREDLVKAKIATGI